MTGALQHCGSERRSSLVRETAIDMGGGLKLNGIDYLEIVDRDAPSESLRQRLIDLTFIRADGVIAAGAPLLAPENFRIEGGSRIKGVRVTAVAIGAGSGTLRLTLDRYGDYSPYELFVQISDTNPEPLPNMDRMLSSIRFSFKVECPSDFDCDDPAPPAVRRDFGPPLNYLAKDYGSFRQLMLDRMAATIPQWTERNPSDIGVTLVEMLAHAADQASYFQDAVHTEAFFGRARRRESVLRHLRLLSYTASQGCNARVAVALEAQLDRTSVAPIFPAGTRLLTHPPRIPGTIPAVIPEDAEQLETMVNGGAIAFETLDPVHSLKVARNAMRLHDWGDDACCLLPGSTAAWLVGTKAGLGLARGDLVIFEELIPFGGTPDDPPDPSHRQVVRLSADPIDMADPIMGAAVVRIDWSEEDGLVFPLTLTDHKGAPGVVARGNVVLADEGRTVDYGLTPAQAGADAIAVGGPADTGLLPDDGPGARLRYRLDADRLVYAPPYDPEAAARSSARRALAADAALAVAQVALAGDGEVWTAVPDLLASDRFSPVVKVEPSDEHGGYVLFGDGDAGRLPTGGAGFTARIRLGGGRRGNVDSDAIGHIVTGDGSAVAGIRNPVAATGGRDPEPLASIRIAAPHAFYRQRRAVTDRDYAAAAQEHADVQRAHATPRWTGSWQTVFLAIDRAGGRDVDPEFEASLRAHLASRRLAGHDLEILPPRYVPLDIVLYVCVCEDHYRGDVEQELLGAFSNGYFRGRPGLFHPDNFSFGDNVLLSRIIAEGMAIEGVKWIGTKDATGRVLGRLGRLEQPDLDYQDAAEIPIGADEIARLDNDPSFPDLGRLRLIMAGGR